MTQMPARSLAAVRSPERASRDGRRQEGRVASGKTGRGQSGKRELAFLVKVDFV